MSFCTGGPWKSVGLVAAKTESNPLNPDHEPNKAFAQKCRVIGQMSEWLLPNTIYIAYRRANRGITHQMHAKKRVLKESFLLETRYK